MTEANPKLFLLRRSNSSLTFSLGLEFLTIGQCAATPPKTPVPAPEPSKIQPKQALEALSQKCPSGRNGGRIGIHLGENVARAPSDLAG
jgi:hypothetical protein